MNPLKGRRNGAGLLLLLLFQEGPQRGPQNPTLQRLEILPMRGSPEEKERHRSVEREMADELLRAKDAERQIEWEPRDHDDVPQEDPADDAQADEQLDGTDHQDKLRIRHGDGECGQEVQRILGEKRDGHGDIEELLRERHDDEAQPDSDTEEGYGPRDKGRARLPSGEEGPVHGKGSATGTVI